MKGLRTSACIDKTQCQYRLLLELMAYTPKCPDCEDVTKSCATSPARQWSMPQYGQPPEEKLAYRSLLRSALQQRGFGNQSAIAVMERPPKRHSHSCTKP